jgi:hypothetical protein
VSTDWASVFQSNRAPHGECSSADEIWDAVLGRLSASRARALVDHSVGCGECAQLWRIARDAQASDELRSTAVEPAPPWRAWLGWGSLVTVSAAAALAFVLLRPAAPPVDRGRTGNAALSARMPTSTLPRDGFRLQWTPAGEGASYRVLVTSTDLTVVDMASALSAPEYQVPASRLASFPAGTTLLWRVEARLPDGKTLSSPATAVTVR